MAQSLNNKLLFYSRILFACYFFISSIGCVDTDKTSTDQTPVSSGFSIKGVSIVAPVKPIDSSALQPMVDINANSIVIMPYAFCSPENPVVRYNKKGQWWGESGDGVISCIELAHKNNLTVMLKPHLWIQHGMYTGAFVLKTDNDWKLWEDSYRNYIVYFGNIADSMKAEMFCIGVELGMAIKERPQFWVSLIDTLRTIYHGKLTYAANWDDYQNFPFWEKLDYIGVDAYFPLDKNATPEINSLKKGWKRYSDDLERISNEKQLQVLFTEYGYRNVDYSTAEPWKENEGKQNDEAQSNAFEAFYQTFAEKKWFAGGFVWKWYLDNKPHHKIDFTPQDKTAATVIKKWYRN